ncbi:MAG: response regulator, partial [Treponema sp.]|nr:response regulator [Treponema sp.]
REGSVTLNIGFSPAGDGRIRLTAHVLDTGIGIKEEDIQKLYSPFERIEERRNRNIEGTGLGMSIVKGLLSSMGGELTVRSEYGKGSDFAIALEQEVRDREPMGDWRPATGTAGTDVGHPRYEESFQAPEAKILVVDDTPLNITVIKGLLKATRIQIDTATDGEAGLLLAKDTPYNVILIDHLMPKMDGIEMLERLRKEQDSPNRNTPCVALTANAINGAKEMYLQSGFTDYLSKPVDPALLESMLSGLLPPSLVIHRGEAGFDDDGGQPVITATEGVSDGLFKDLFGLDIGKALQNCGGKDIFMDTLRIFHECISPNAEKIEGFAGAGDWKNYTILVHALKSSARLIGMEQLSDEARCLEELGKRAQEDDKKVVLKLKEDTPPLLEHYRSYRMKLEPLVKR